MPKIHHLNCGTLHKPPFPKAACHCLLIEDRHGLALVDTGIGLQDVLDPIERLSAATIEAAGYQFEESATALRQLEARGFSAKDVLHIFLTHGDPDHTGGLSDFPAAEVHISAVEFAAIQLGTPPYAAAQFAHGPQWRKYAGPTESWFGIPAQRMMCDLDTEVWLVELFGHTPGHCGVAVRLEDHWLLHVGDAYFLRAELFDQEHPVGQVAAMRAANNRQRLQSLGQLRRVLKDHSAEVQMFGYHDFSEFA
jgi:glyoxylase-like metal-dependent hydrolase (beta-lactamase superfamily II)